MIVLEMHSSSKDNFKSKNTSRSEIREYLDIRSHRRHIFPRAALVGICAGTVALLFRMSLAGAETLRNRFFEWTHTLPFAGWIFPVIFSAAGAFVSIFLVRRFAPETSGSGIPHLEAVLRRFRKMNWKRILPIKFLGGIFAIGGGMALGREGPTVQMGGAVGDMISRLLRVSKRERITLISAGAGAGLAGAFNAPFSGLVFVLEEVRRDFQPIVFGATFVAAVIADIITKVGVSQYPVFDIPAYPTPPLSALPVFALLGIVTGFLGILFNKSLMLSLNFYQNLTPKKAFIATACIGGAIGLTGWFAPNLLGLGHQMTESALKGNILLPSILIIFVSRFFMTAASYGTGAPGGIFAPILVLGSLIGLGIGAFAQGLLPAQIPNAGVFAVVGMAAYFTGIVRAPLTGIMLIIEMTGNYALMLPLLVSCFCSYAVGEFMKDRPIYEALMERDLKRSGIGGVLAEPAVLDFTIEEHAPFVGKQVRDLGLPQGCVLIRCSDGQNEWVPTAKTVMDSHMKVTAVIAPEATEGINILREGSKAP